MLVDLSDRGLIQLLQLINSGRRQGRPEDVRQAEELSQAEQLAEALFKASTHLVVYGTLVPGEENEWVLEPLQGRWSQGYVRGKMFAPGTWGDGIEYPGMVWEPEGESVPVKVFGSARLSGDWERLDAFEGEEYLRILVPVESESGTTQIANLYSMRV